MRGMAPGSPKQTGQTRVSGMPPFQFSQVQNAFILVKS